MRETILFYAVPPGPGVGTLSTERKVPALMTCRGNVIGKEPSMHGARKAGKMITTTFTK